MNKDSAPPSQPTPMGLYDRPRAEGMSAAEVIAVALSVLWLAGATVFFLTLPSEPAPDSDERFRFVMTVLAVFLPIALIWVAALAARSARVMREESARLQITVDSMRQAYMATAQKTDGSGDTSVARKLDEIAASARKTETALATFSSSRKAVPTSATPGTSDPVPVSEDGQSALQLGTSQEEMSAPLSAEDFIRALNFPETAEDEVGFLALKRGLRDRQTGQLIQAAQDVLTLLSQDGIYMDDLRPDMAHPDVWRAFSEGRRGRAIAGLGGVRDRSSLALCAGRMKQDTIFRDAAHHFLRKFDQIVSAFTQTASDGEIVALANTRTARAFMLLGRVAGTFD